MSVLLVAVPVIVFALVWQYYAVNVPKWDDHALRAYLYESDRETTLSGKIYQLFKQHNEHRIVYDRIVAALDYRLFGKLSYVHLMIVGNLSLVGLLAIFGAVLLRAGKSVVYLLPVSLLLFNLSHWENMFWGMAALQNFSVVFWVIGAIYCLTHTNRWMLGLLLAVLATLTSGNGLLVWPVGFVLLALRPGNAELPGGPLGRRPVRPLTGWAVSAVVVIGLYFVGFSKPTSNPPLRGPVTDLLKGWLAFSGAAADVLPINPPVWISILLGSLMVLATLSLVAWGLMSHWTIITRLVRRVRSPRRSGFGTAQEIPAITLFFWGCSGFILGTAAIVAWTRTSFGIDLTITSRYKIYSLTLLALLYVCTVSRLPKRAGQWVGAGGAVGSLLIAWLSYNSFLAEAIWWRHWMLTSQFNWTYSTDRPVGRLDAISKKYTTPAPAFYDADPAAVYDTGQPPPVPVIITKTPAGFELRQATLTAQDRRDSRSYVVARSPKRTYLFPTRQNQNLTGRMRLWPANGFTTGFTAPIAHVDLDAGTYRLFILRVATDEKLTLHPTDQTIRSVGQVKTASGTNW